MDTGLEGRVAVIAGAAGNIGSASVLALAQEGVDLILCTRAGIDQLQSVAVAAEALGVRTIVRKCDVTQLDNVEELVKEGLNEFGRIDILVNAATVWFPERPAWEVDISEWQQKFEVDMFGVVNMSQTVLPNMISNKFGRIINFSGISALEGEEVMTATTKMGVLGFTRGVAGLFAEDGITANCISPGGIQVERNAGLPVFPPDDAQPIKRAGTPAEVASMVVYLSSVAASYITGQWYGVNGGRYYNT